MIPRLANWSVFMHCKIVWHCSANYSFKRFLKLFTRIITVENVCITKTGPHCKLINIARARCSLLKQVQET